MQTKNKIAVGLLCFWQFLSVLSIANLNSRTIELEKDMSIQVAHSLFLKAALNRTIASNSGASEAELNKLKAEEDEAYKELSKKIGFGLSNSRTP